MSIATWQLTVWHSLKWEWNTLLGTCGADVPGYCKLVTAEVVYVGRWLVRLYIYRKSGVRKTSPSIYIFPALEACTGW